MISLEIRCPPEQKDMLLAELWAAGTAGIVEMESGLRAFFEDSADRTTLTARFHPISWRREEQRDWVALSRAGWEPLAVGDRFFLVPQWRNDPTPAGRFRIVVNSGMAFGTGRHETTQLCLEALERHVQPGKALLDVGTGSGILAHAAALLGAQPVWACDVDSEAARIARAESVPHVFLGSLEAVRPESASIIAANISRQTVVRLMPDLLRCLVPGGTAVLSGFERHEVPEVQAAVELHSGTVRDVSSKGDWAALIVARGRP